MLHWLWSKYYDKIMHDAEEKGLRDWRGLLLKNISGDVLEIGCGTGANLEFYPATLNRLVLVEPCVHMFQKLQEKTKTKKLPHLELVNEKAECLSLQDASFDFVVCTLVLCSVSNLEETLFEIYRLLKPQGKLVFIEHIAAENNEQRYRWQLRLEFLWKRFAAGCHLTRCTEEAIVNAGFKLLEIKHQSMRGVRRLSAPVFVA